MWLSPLRYGRAANGESHITVSVAQRDASVTLSVTDNGVGVPMEKLQQISQRWVQEQLGKRSRRAWVLVWLLWVPMPSCWVRKWL